MNHMAGVESGELRHIVAGSMHLDERCQTPARFSQASAERIAKQFNWPTFNPIKVR